MKNIGSKKARAIAIGGKGEWKESQGTMATVEGSVLKQMPQLRALSKVRPIQIVKV